jgi:hypothetical protein
MACRTEACGMALYQCDSCAESHQVYRSCGNCHCPTCQHNKTQQWLQKQLQRQLPGHHFLGEKEISLLSSGSRQLIRPELLLVE